MNVDRLREVCLSFPGATEQVQWGNDLVFKVGGKMFAVTPLEPAPVCLSFKASPENFAELTERPNIIPAPYLARAQWVALQTRDALAAEGQALRQYVPITHAHLETVSGGVNDHEVIVPNDNRSAYVPIYENPVVGGPGPNASPIDVLHLQQRKLAATIDLGKPLRPHRAEF